MTRLSKKLLNIHIHIFLRLWCGESSMVNFSSILKYRAEKKSLQILLSSTQAGPGRKVKQEQEEISRNHVPRLFLGSVHYVGTLQAPRSVSFACKPSSFPPFLHVAQSDSFSDVSKCSDTGKWDSVLGFPENQRRLAAARCLGDSATASAP